MGNMNEIENHDLFITSGIYIQAIRDLYPNEDDDFYNAVMYAGCTNGNVFNDLEEDTQKNISKDLEYYLEK